MMEATVKEIAALLRSSEQMAAQFVQRVQTRVGMPVSQAEILAAMKKVPTKSLTMEKVITKVKQQHKAARGPRQRSKTVHPSSRSTSQPKGPASARSPLGQKTAPTKKTKTALDRLESVLQENWDRAEAEGLRPNRVSVEAFVNAVYQYTDRREGSRQRILEAARKLDQDDVLLTPALIADIVHELFKS